MKVDQSLAKGLSKRTFRYLAERSSLCSKYAKQNVKKFATRRQMESFCTRLVNSYPDAVVNIHAGGSQRRPFLCISNLCIAGGNIHEDWSEDLLCENTEVLCADATEALHDNVLAYTISRHATQRYFQRSCKGGLEFEEYYFAFFGSIKYLRLWSELWSFLLYFSQDMDQDLSGLCLIFPAEDGIYLGKLYNEPRAVGIRTFVSRDMLTRQQSRLLDVMLQISRWAEGSPLTFAVVLAYWKLVDLGAIEMLGRIAFSRLGADQALLADLTFGRGADRDASGLKASLAKFFEDQVVDDYQEWMERGSAAKLYQEIVFAKQPGTFLNKLISG